jgi:signal transduction histidine kinase/ActR/RegA family two-component response regulator
MHQNFPMPPRNNLWSRLTRPADGVAHAYEEASRWALRNSIFLLVGLAAATGVPVFAAVGQAEVFLASAAVCAGCLLGFVLSRAGHRRSAALLAIVPLNAALFYNTQNFGPGLFESTYLVSIGLLFMTLERRDTGAIAAAVALTLAPVLLGAIEWWPPIAVLDRGRAAGLRLATLVLVIGTIGCVFMYFLITRDRSIARLHEAVAAAAAASEAKSRFLANMSHELRTPMNGVLGVLDMLEDSPLGPEQRDHVRSARAAGHSLLGIIGDILDLAKVEAGMLALSPAPFDLRATVEEVVRQTAAQVRGPSVSVVARYPGHVPDRVIGDAKRIRQILVNLLGNAAKFTQAGEIAVSVSCEPGPAGASVFSLVVSDTGIGIPRDALSKIFDEFEQVDDSVARLRGGTGLGLAIVRELVAQMNGSVHVDSEPGLGSRFCVYLALPLASPLGSPLASSLASSPALPVATASEDVPVAAARSAVRAAGDGVVAAVREQPHVLVVEDNLVNQKVAVHRLERLGCRVDVAGDGNEALERIAQNPYDVVFMDVQMPGMDGLETTRTIRARERENGGRLRIVAMTAHAFADDRQRCLDAGMDDHLSKPVVADALEAVLNRFLAQP